LTENHSFDQGQMVLMALQPQLLDEVAFPIVKEQSVPGGSRDPPR
jgi:hypothetical protein